MRILQLLALLTIGALGSCSIMNQQADYTDLGGSQWKLISIDGSPMSLGDNAILTFDEKENKINGVAACNKFSADYEMLRKAVKFSSIISTKMYCEGKMDEENKILSNLPNVTRYEVKANMLYLYSQDQLLLTYKR